MRTRFRSCECPRVMLSHLSVRSTPPSPGQGVSHCSKSRRSLGLATAPQGKTQILCRKGPWERGAVIFQVPELASVILLHGMQRLTWQELEQSALVSWNRKWSVLSRNRLSAPFWSTRNTSCALSSIGDAVSYLWMRFFHILHKEHGLF